MSKGWKRREEGVSKHNEVSLLPCVVHVCLWQTGLRPHWKETSLPLSKCHWQWMENPAPLGYIRIAGGYLCTAEVNKICVILKPAACKAQICVILKPAAWKLKVAWFWNLRHAKLKAAWFWNLRHAKLKAAWFWNLQRAKLKAAWFWDLRRAKHKAAWFWTLRRENSKLRHFESCCVDNLEQKLLVKFSIFL